LRGASSEPNHGKRLLWLLIVVGTGMKLVLAFTTYGLPFDIASWQLVDAAVRDDPFTAYDALNPAGSFPRFPYPPGYWPVILASGSLEAHTGIAFESLIQVPAIAADAGIALLVWSFLGRRGATTRTRLAGAGLVALGPVFGWVSGWYGQFDAVAILPAVAALTLWERPGTPRRALVAGILIGLGAALKTTPGLMVLALLPTARSRREAITLVVTAVAVPLAMLLPIAVADPPTSLDGGMASIVTYEGTGGAGLSLVFQPGLAARSMERRPVQENAANEVLGDYGSALTLAALAGITWLMLRRRTPPALAATVVWLVLYVFGYSFAVRYAIWGLPFFVMAGYLREAAALQLGLAVVVAVFAAGSRDEISQVELFSAGPVLTGVFAALMLAVWLAFVAALLRLTRGIAKQPAARSDAAARV
jgi:hypothetical protein